MGSIYLRKYGVQATVDFCLYKLDGTGLKIDAVSASGDVTLYRDEAAVETLDADAFVDEGAIYSLVLSATEMEAARIIVCIVDQTNPQVWLDKTLIIETYGNASAQHAFDLDTATQDVNLTQIGGAAQSATDLKDFADAGYDPATDQVTGVKLCDQTTLVDNVTLCDQTTLVDTTTTNTDMLTVADIADGVWDEVITAAAHAVADSPALYLRQLHQTLVSSVNQAQAGAAGTITLAAAESAVNDFFKGQLITITAGTGAGQSRACYGYNGATKVALIRPNWVTAPDATSWYAIGNLGSAVVAAIEDIDFSATMLASLDAATPSVTVSDKTGFSLSAAGVDSILDEVVDTNAPANANSLRETVNVIASAVTGKTSGGGTATLKSRDLGDTKDRVTLTVDADGNRTASTVDGT